MTGRKRRELRPEERRLWTEVARAILPLPGRAVPEPPAPAPAEQASRPETQARAVAAAMARPASAPPLPPLAPLERRQARGLARGRLAPDATLDLHGLTQAEAHRRLVAFLHAQQVRGHGLVRVITGHGGRDGGERGILRRTVPIWLGLPDMRRVVLGFEEAGPRQGGAGALHVRLRRRRTGPLGPP